MTLKDFILKDLEPINLEAIDLEAIDLEVTGNGMMIFLKLLDRNKNKWRIGRIINYSKKGFGYYFYNFQIIWIFMIIKLFMNDVV